MALVAGKVEFRQYSSVGGVWEMPAEGQVQQGNMCFAVGGPSVDCEEAAAVGASSFFPEYDLKAAAGRCSVQPRHICACKHCKAEQALGHLKFAHAEACHLQDQSKFDWKRHHSQFRSGICFQSCMLWAALGQRVPGAVWHW